MSGPRYCVNDPRALHRPVLRDELTPLDDSDKRTEIILRFAGNVIDRAEEGRREILELPDGSRIELIRKADQWVFRDGKHILVEVTDPSDLVDTIKAQQNRHPAEGEE